MKNNQNYSQDQKNEVTKDNELRKAKELKAAKGNDKKFAPLMEKLLTFFVKKEMLDKAKEKFNIVWEKAEEVFEDSI